jgi:hypothetical protein
METKWSYQVNMPETQHASSDSPSFPGFNGDTSIKQSSTMKSMECHTGQDHSSHMIEVAAECGQSTDK